MGRLNTLAERFLSFTSSSGSCVVRRMYRDLLDFALEDSGSVMGRAYGRQGWVPCDQADPYGSYAELWGAASTELGPVLISNVNHAHPYLTDAQNLWFRAYHDALHLTGGYSFDAMDECQLVADWVRRVDSCYDPSGEICCASVVHVCEVAGQALAYGLTGEFPTAGGVQFVPDPTDTRVIDWAVEVVNSFA